MRTKFPDSMSSPWSFDVYSLGVVLLEITMGFPVWVSSKVEMHHFNQKNPSVYNHGLMHQMEEKDVVKKLRHINSVQALQIRTVPQILNLIKTHGNYRNLDLVLLLTKMLDINP